MRKNKQQRKEIYRLLILKLFILSLKKVMAENLKVKVAVKLANCCQKKSKYTTSDLNLTHISASYMCFQGHT